MVLSDQCCLCKLPSYERSLHVRLTFHSNSNVIKIDEEMSSKPSELLETKGPIPTCLILVFCGLWLQLLAFESIFIQATLWSLWFPLVATGSHGYSLCLSLAWLITFI